MDMAYKNLHALFTLLSTLCLTACSQTELASLVPTNIITPTFSVEVHNDDGKGTIEQFKGAGYTTVNAAFRPYQSNNTLELDTSSDTLTIETQGNIYDLEKFSMPFWTVSYYKAFTGSTASETDFIFTWIRSDTSETLISNVTLPIAPVVTYNGSNKINMGDSITLNWTVDPASYSFTLTPIAECGLTFDVDDNAVQLALVTEPEPNNGVFDLRDRQTQLQSGVDNGSLILDTDTLFTDHLLDLIADAEFIDTSAEHYCEITIVTRRTKNGNLDSAFHSGSIQSTQISTTRFYVNVSSL